MTLDAPTATPTATPTDTPTGAPTATPTPTATPAGQSASAILLDSDFEMPDLVGSGWSYEGSGGGRTTGDFLSWVNYGVWDADCGRRFQLLNETETGAIYQTVAWSGGNMVLSWSARPTTSFADYFLDGYSLDVSVLQGATPVLTETYVYSAGVASWVRTFVDLGVQAAGDYTVRFQSHTLYWGDSTPAMSGLAIDNTWLDAVAGTSCNVESTPTPTPRTPAPTGTPVRTSTPTGPTPTRTATPTGPTPTANSTMPGPGPSKTPAPSTIYNCDFELGSPGWTLTGAAAITTPNGIIGPHYGYMLSGGRIAQNFVSVNAAPLFATFYARGVGRVTLSGGGSSVAVWSGSYADWTLVNAYGALPAAFGYKFEAEATDGNGFAVDAVSVSANGYTYCATYTTPTPGGTPSPWPTGTFTPAATGTSRATTTARPTGTLSGPQQTSTAQGTPVGTVTPSGSGGGGVGTCTDDPINCPVPEQPTNYGDIADCNRPAAFWEVAAWIDYARCDAMRFFAWSGNNTEQLVSLGADLDQYEPFGAAAEVVDSVEAVQTVQASYRWIDTGYTGAWDVQRPSIIDISQSFMGGNLSLSPNVALIGILDVEINYCNSRMISVFSTNVVYGVCVVWAYLHTWGIVAWIQFFFDLAVNLMLVRYLWKYLT